MTYSEIANELIKQGVTWAVRAGGVHWKVIGREREKISDIIHEIDPTASVAKVSLALTSILHERYEKMLAEMLAEAHRIEHKPLPGKTIPRCHIDGAPAYPGPIIERIRARIGGSTGFYPAESRARNRRVLKIAAELSEQKARKEE